MPKKKRENEVTSAENSRRFIEMAKELGCDDNGEAFERLFGNKLARDPEAKAAEEKAKKE